MDSYCVYRHVAPNGKMYVGITRQEPKSRWANGMGYCKQPLFFNAINKYGWDNFKHEILLSELDVDNASLAEQLFIAYWKTNSREYGYNCRDGGIEYSGHSKETKQKMSEAQCGEKNHRHGKTYSHTEETKYKISESHKGYHHTDETKRKMSESHKGKVITQEIREKMSKAHQGYIMPESVKVLKRHNKSCRPVKQIDRINGNVINVFYSIGEANRCTGIQRSDIGSCCNGKLSSAGGYRWEYDSEYIKENGERRCMP